MSGNLYVVATPIGNLDDLAPRARQVLAAVDLIAAEDTRHTGRLLMSIGAKKRLLALHEHNEQEVVTRLLSALQNGQSVALVSDAGTPLVSDPGFRLLQAAHANGITVSPIPGPSAVTAALSVAGLPTDRFCFEGFLPARQAARRKQLEALANETRTLVFFESVHRIRDALQAMSAVFGEQRVAFIGRELTKMHEQCVHASLGSLVQRVDEGTITTKGEFVVIVSGASRQATTSLDIDRLLLELARHQSAKDAARAAADITGEKKNLLYQRLLDLKK
ncbi:MAG: 16S rRNA (cytidine(1402)-2'-O)-methyltransferase [Gammaproteobacteria bacterium]|nr:16S rRNA (cytidine(1402)-2'-O)-methyltransferase [Gammaproteobacteria bacterium]